jgi:protein-disulfide isomerase
MNTPENQLLTTPLGGSDHVQGDDHARITLLEYGDYQCPYCGQAYPIIKELQRRLGRDLRFAFRNMPLNEIHPQAELAAEGAESADAQGRFWPMHDLIYEHQRELRQGLDAIVRLGVRLELDVQTLEADLRSHRYQERVKRDFMSGVRSGVAGTPTFFIDGVRFDGDWTHVERFALALRKRG